jgi:cytoskeletal protein RodZ
LSSWFEPSLFGRLEAFYGQSSSQIVRSRLLEARSTGTGRHRIHDFPRGGSSSDAEDDVEDEDEEENESEYDDESDDESTEVEDPSEVAIVATGTKSKRKKAASKSFHDSEIAAAVGEYDAPLVASPFLNLYVSLGVMFLAKKVDLLSPVMVRIARYVPPL